MRRQIPESWKTVPRRLWPYQPKPRRLFLTHDTATTKLDLLPDSDRVNDRRLATAMVPSLILHVVAAFGILTLPIGVDLHDEEYMQLALRYKDPTRLVAPPPELLRKLIGQPAPAVREMTLERLMARPGGAPPPPAPSPEPESAKPEPKPFVPPAPAEVEEPAATVAEPPPIEVAQAPPVRPLVELTSPALPVPVLPSSSKPKPEPPKIAFEEPGAMTFSTPSRGDGQGIASGSGGGGSPAIPNPPASSVSEAVQELSRTGGGGHGLVIGDVEAAGGIFEARGLPPSRGDTGSNIQLLSDPKGVDFRPYLIRVLASVRRNWFAVMPASAKLGRRGKVIIQFSIDHSGNVPKLVIATPSGSDPLDRAAVAAISASNPFPPLPPDYRAEDIRLQLNFLYNLK